LRVLDPGEKPLEVWNHNTTNCGMRHLRSPATHNIDLPVLSLYRFAKERYLNRSPDFIAPYNRPSLSLFKRHCDSVVRQHKLADLRIKGRALALRKKRRAVAIESTAGTILSRNVVLAIGLGDQPIWPAWARCLRRKSQRIDHIFAPGFKTAGIPDDTESVVVVGGGISAVQTALTLCNRLNGTVRVVSKHEPRESQFDFDPCWIGPKCLREFYRLDFDQRRATIDRARICGSLPADVFRDMHAAIGSKRLRFLVSAVRKAIPDGRRIRLDTAAGTRWADIVILATGFSSRRPGGKFIDQVVKEFRLPCGPCGYPMIAADLRWHANLFAIGPLGELQLGPCARNIIGARNAGRQLLRAIPKPA
jgi:hypothetical protein